jgi:nucleotide-binding universal stress UspA family protein
LLNGDPVETILREAALWEPDLIVFTTQGHMDFLDALRGSTTERVLRGAHGAGETSLIETNSLAIQPAPA